MDSFRLCWQMVPGGRTECTAPIPQDVAEFRMREQTEAFPGLRIWIAEDGPAEATSLATDGDA
jgi:hypothetical protein